MRVLPVPGGPERKERTDRCVSGTGSAECGAQVLSRVSGSSANPGIGKAPDLIHESAMSQETL